MDRTEDLDDAPILMIEGDEFYVNHDAVCRSFYELEQWNNGILQPLSLEEEYDLRKAHKTFSLRHKMRTLISTQHLDPTKTTSINSRDDKVKPTQAPCISVLPHNARAIVNLGIVQRQVCIQEIDQGVFGSAGTGATTWESSIAMALLVSSQPNLLKGHVLELGSGVGLGGILTGMMVMPSAILSLTLTDGNDEVLEACRGNCQRAKLDHPNLRILRLDWNELPKPSPKYDTILVSDCAYKYPDVFALAAACKNSLQEPHGKAHIFGPYNRGGLHDLLRELKERQDMDVEVSCIEMSRYRLQSSLNTADSFTLRDDEAMYASRHVVKFLHITATHKNRQQELLSHRESSSMDAID
jgi:predicted nicotinamide N-methyase